MKDKDRLKFDPGYYSDISNDDYHSSLGYGSTTLKILAEKTKAHMDYKRAQPREMTEPLIKGQMLHSMILEPDKTEDEFAVRPEGLKKPTAAQLNAAKPSAKSLEQIDKWEKWQRLKSHRLEVTHEQFQHCEAMSNSVRNHPIMGAWFDGSINGMAEQSIYYWYNPEDWDEKNDYRTMLKVRPDWILEGHPVIFDIKTTKDASFTEFMKSARNLKYHMSAAMYIDGCNRNREFCEKVGVIAFTKFVWVVVENVPPYEATYYEISPEDLAEGRYLYHRLARKLDLYNRSDWKGYGEADENGLITPTGRISEIPKWPYDVV